MVTVEVDVCVRVTRVGIVVITHHLEVPNLAYARAECARFEGIAEELGRPAAILMLPDRVLPPASREVIDVYRESAERTSIAAWAAVVGGVSVMAGDAMMVALSKVAVRKPSIAKPFAKRSPSRIGTSIRERL